MNFELSDQQTAIVEAVRTVCSRFDMEYWDRLDRDHTFPHDFHAAMCEGGWLGVAMPEALGGAGLGILEAALVMQAISESGAGMSGASAVHMNVFGLNPVVVFGSPEQQARFLPPLIAGREKAFFAVTEPDAGLDTTRLKTFARKVDGGYQVSGRKIWISTAQVADRMLLLAARARWSRSASRQKVCRCSTPRWTATASRCARSTRWAAPPSTPTCCSSTSCSCRTKT